MTKPSTAVVQSLVKEMEARMKSGHPYFYHPFLEGPSKILRDHHESMLDISLEGGNALIKNQCGTLLAVGYTRVVIGDYGAFIEISPAQIQSSAIRERWPGPPDRPVKYIWMETRDMLKTKVYSQQRGVAYADYQPGMFYVAPSDVTVRRSHGI